MNRQTFIEHFLRDNEGAWLCVRPAEIDLPAGRVQITPGTRVRPGSTYMGIDLARLLEEQYERRAGP